MTQPTNRSEKEMYKQEGREGEFGVIGADQENEDDYDDRSEVLDDQGRIRFSQKKLYGRDKELERLDAIYEDVLQVKDSKDAQQRAVIFISGYSGCGKTALVKKSVQQLKSKNSSPLFMPGKYEVARKTTPFSAIIDGFTHWCHSISTHSTEIHHFKEIQNKLEEFVGEDAAMLLEMIPSLKLLIHNDTSINSERSPQSSQGYSLKENMDRFKFVFLSLLRLMCSDKRPLVLFLDDLQWADYQSLELLSYILAENPVRNLIFIGSFRSNEVKDGHRLLKVIEDIEKKMTIDSLELSNLTQDHVGEFISDTLQISCDEALPLTSAVFTKTLGNVLFTIQALEQLVRKNALFYDMISFCWSWNLQQEQLEELMSDDVIKMVKSKIEHMPQLLQRMLIVAAYTRRVFDVMTILELMNAAGHKMEKEKLMEIIDKAIIERFLLKVSNSEEYEFFHDKIQEAAAIFLDEAEREDLVLIIGKTLALRGAKNDVGEDWMLFSAAQHLNSIPLGRYDGEAKINLAKLNLRTAELSKKLLAFSDANTCIEIGIKCLPEDMWGKHFKLALGLKSIGADVAVFLGNMDEADSYSREVLAQKNATTVDKIQAYKVQIEVKCIKGKRNEALATCYDILDTLGCKIPRNARSQRIQSLIKLQTTKLMHISKEKNIVGLPFITDAMVADKIDILDKAANCARVLNMADLYILLRCVSIQCMEKDGINARSGAAIASFANILMHVRGDFKGGAKLAELALAVQGRLKSNYTSCRTFNTSNCNVLGWVKPLRSTLKFHTQATECGWVSGNIDGAYSGIYHGQMCRFYAGMPLSLIEKECSECVPKARGMGHPWFGNNFSMMWQIMLNLIGKSTNTVVITGTVANEDFLKSKGFGKTLAVRKSTLYAYFGDFEAGAEDALERGDSYAKDFIGVGYGFEPFFRGISLHAMARRTNLPKYKKPANRVRSQVKALVKKGCVNMLPALCLLQAENAALCGKTKKAREKYKEAVSIALKGQFYNIAALASERYAEYLLEINDTRGAKNNFIVSINQYAKWGANSKVKILQQKLQDL